MHTVRMTRRITPRLVFLCGMMLLVSGMISSAQVKEVDQPDCKEQKGIWIKATQGVPGDGTSHVKIVATGPEGSRILGGQARAMRQNIDNQFTSTCLMNPAQPPTVDNSLDRRCTPPANDMSVEQCSINGSAVTCEYVNAKDAPNKLVELGVCFKQ